MKNKVVRAVLAVVMACSLFASCQPVVTFADEEYKPKVVAFVPIKLNNQRCPGKNIKEIAEGVPLIHCILTALKQSKNIDEIYVYCSDSAAQLYLLPEIKFKHRSPKLDTNSASISEVVAAFVNDIDADIYICAHATAPFLKSETIDDCIDNVLKGTYDSALTVSRLSEFIWKDGKPINYDPANIPRTQDLPPMYYETCGMWVFKKDLAKNENRRVGHKPYLKEINKIEAIDIDTPEDFAIASALYKENLKKIKNTRLHAS